MAVETATSKTCCDQPAEVSSFWYPANRSQVEHGRTRKYAQIYSRTSAEEIMCKETQELRVRTLKSIIPWGRFVRLSFYTLHSA